jgi:hypothetical protein
MTEPPGTQNELFSKLIEQTFLFFLLCSPLVISFTRLFTNYNPVFWQEPAEFAHVKLAIVDRVLELLLEEEGDEEMRVPVARFFENLVGVLARNGLEQC